MSPLITDNLKIFFRKNISHHCLLTDIIGHAIQIYSKVRCIISFEINKPQMPFENLILSFIETKAYRTYTHP